MVVYTASLLNRARQPTARISVEHRIFRMDHFRLSSIPSGSTYLVGYSGVRRVSLYVKTHCVTLFPNY